ncbi:MAG: SixA phosphatase family protein [Acidimicrobiales bacterium]
MPVLLVRHAVALSRRSWAGDDVERPLDKRGHRQATALVKALEPFDVVRVLSSPAVRCIATVEPLAVARGLEVKPGDELFEGNGRRALALVRSLAESDAGGADGPAIVLCSHGDVIPEVLDLLAHEGADLGPERRSQKGSVWVLHRGPKGVAGRYLPPPA